jgi:hypothetical protein
VSRHALEVIALGDSRVGVMGSMLDKGGDISLNKTYAWAKEAQWGVAGAASLYNAKYLGCQNFNRAKAPTRACHVVNCSPMVSAVLLVIHLERDRVRLHQFKE